MLIEVRTVTKNFSDKYHEGYFDYNFKNLVPFDELNPDHIVILNNFKNSKIITSDAYKTNIFKIKNMTDHTGTTIKDFLLNKFLNGQEYFLDRFDKLTNFKNKNNNFECYFNFHTHDFKNVFKLVGKLYVAQHVFITFDGPILENHSIILEPDLEQSTLVSSVKNKNKQLTFKDLIKTKDLESKKDEITKLCDSSTPSDWYFCCYDFEGTIINFIPKDIWDNKKNNSLYDLECIDHIFINENIIPSDFDHSEDFMYTSESSIKDVENDLLSKGFTMNESFSEHSKIIIAEQL